MNVKYRENIIIINDKKIEMKSKNILKFKEVNNMLRIEKINGKNVWEILKLRVSESQKEFVAANDRSEEHTSELQSPDNLVCRLLLEKKKE